MQCFLKKSKAFFSYITILFLPFLVSCSTFAQEVKTLMLEPELNFHISTDSKWSYTFGLANRGILIDKIDAETFSENSTKHLEINQWTIYQTSEQSDLSLGIRYRLREIFDVPHENEVRIIQQYFYEDPNPLFDLEHRGRFEQRFRNSETIFRLRYQLGIWKPVTEKLSLGVTTESLYSVSPQSKPAPEQRIALLTANTFFKDLSLKIGVEYRMDNYLRDQENNLFILTWATYSL